MATNDGGPAFPGQCDCDAHGLFIAKDGMTLRDYFAAAAMQGMIANGIDYEVLTEMAYDIADAMLSAREGKE